MLDLSYLSSIPNLTVIAPKSLADMKKCFEFAIKHKGPVAIRYPRGGDNMELPEISKMALGKWEIVKHGEKTAIIATGKMVQLAVETDEEYNLDAKIINATFIKPVDEKMLEKLVKDNYNIITMEDGVLNGGLYTMVLSKLNELGYTKRVVPFGFKDKFIEQGTPDELYKHNNITKEDIKKVIDEFNN